MDGNDQMDLRDRFCNDGNRINRSTGSCSVLNFCIGGVESLGTAARDIFSWTDCVALFLL